MIFAALTPRESQIANLAGFGYTMRRIGQDLHISHRTVETHLDRVYQKLGLCSRDELIDHMRGAI